VTRRIREGPIIALKLFQIQLHFDGSKQTNQLRNIVCTEMVQCHKSVMVVGSNWSINNQKKTIRFWYGGLDGGLGLKPHRRKSYRRTGVTRSFPYDSYLHCEAWYTTHLSRHPSLENDCFSCTMESRLRVEAHPQRSHYRATAFSVMPKRRQMSLR
jgi:hypothetical protein